MFENIPKRWNIFSLNDLATIITGNTPPKNHSEYYETEDILWVKPSDLSEWNPWLWETEEKLSENARKVIRILPVNSVLVSCIGTIGKIGIAPVELATNQQINSVIFNDKIINFKYGYYAFKYYKERLANLASNAVVPIINKTQFSTFKIPVPPTLEEQQEIVDVLDAASEIIRLRTACIESAQDLIPALFQEMFGDIKSNDKNWKSCYFNDLAFIDRKNISAEELKHNAYRYIGLEHIEKDTGKILIDLENNFNIDLKSNKYYFTREHVLYGKLRPYLNKVALPTCEGVCSTDIFPIIPIKNFSNKYFIKYLMSSPYFVQMTSSKTSGANLPRIGTKALELIPVICPDIEIQEQFAQKATEIENYIQEQEKELENAKQMFQSLLHHAFTGELTRRAYEN